MNGLGEIQEYIKSFICEKEQVQQQIAGIEERRTQLAKARNEKKKLNIDDTEVNELGKQISELGNQSQELQNKLDFKHREVKIQINLIIDNLIAERIRGIRKINEEIQELEKKIGSYEERNTKYLLQKQEFYVRFGRMPELSENSKREIKLQEKEIQKSSLEIQELGLQVEEIQNEISLLTTIKRKVKNGNWSSVIGDETVQENESVSVESIRAEEISLEDLGENEEMYVEQFEPIEELNIQEFEPIQELIIEELEPLPELHIEEFSLTENAQIEEVEKLVYTEPIIEKNAVDEIEELARAIIEEIVAEQTKNLNCISEIEEFEDNVEEDIITFEEEIENKDRLIIPLFGQKATISNITIKLEEGELLYKAKMSDGKEVKIYPSQLGEGNVLLRDKQNRDECKEILVNYAISEYRIFDKKVINKIDPLICELLIECAEKYSYDAQELIYNYAMSFSYNEGSNTDLVPSIVYNLSFIEESKLSKREKAIINKICKNARKNAKIDIIESFSGFMRFKYIFKRLFTANNIKVLPEAKY